MEVDTKLESSVSTNIVWLVRIALPILVFFFYYLQQKHTGGKYCYSRDIVLQARKDAETDEAPASLRTLRLVDEMVAQQLLGGPPPRQGGGANRGEGRGKGARKGGGGKGGDAVRKTSSSQSLDNASPTAGTPSATPSAPKKPKDFLSEEERMQFASLLNYVAFLHKDRAQRIFLCDTGRPPPPPLLPRAKVGSGPPALLEADSAEAINANKEAQMVLKGLVNPKFGMKGENVPKSLHQSLTEPQSHASVRASESTYALMVEACVNARDLKGASDFLMKMESGGHAADSALLDKVMDLYQEKTHSKVAADAESGGGQRNCDETGDVSAFATAGTGLGAIRRRPDGGFSGTTSGASKDKDGSFGLGSGSSGFSMGKDLTVRGATSPLPRPGMRPWCEEESD